MNNRARVWSLVGTAGTTVVVELSDGQFALVDRRLVDNQPRQVWRWVEQDQLKPSSDIGWLDVGIFLGTVDARGFNDERKGESMNATFQEVYDSLTQGDKIHMANKLYKDDGIVPSKLLVKEPKFEQYDVVQVIKRVPNVNGLDLGDIGVILEVDDDDDELPYLVKVNARYDTSYWADANQIEKFPKGG